MLSRNIERMLNDVWRQGHMVYHTFDNIKCRILSQDWPAFNDTKFKLADELLELRQSFEDHFLSQPENEKKKLKWVQDCGKLTLVICGV